MKKRVVFIFIFTILLGMNLVFAAGNETGVDKAYSCLKDQLGNNCGDTKSTQQAVFNLLAMSHDSGVQSKCRSSLMDKEKDNCWAETTTGNCNIKSTALAVIALKNINSNVKDYVAWILGRRKSATGLTWFLEIDANNKTDCTINGKKITIQEDKKITGSDPSGLTRTYEDYWYKINDINKNYSISCDQNFVSTVLYQKPGSTTYYVSSEPHSAAGFDSTNEKVEAYCFSTTSTCDYEGSLWATIALSRSGEDIAAYTPYLLAMSDDSANKKYLPYSFLYMLYPTDENYKALVDLQVQGKIWDASGNKFYDTALALLALQKVDSDEVKTTRDYLLTVQDSSGCWSSNTAFLLYAGWGKPPTPAIPDGPSLPPECEKFSHYCVSRGECDLNNSLDEFYCQSLSDVCCQVRPIQQTCSEKKGVVCKSSETCSEYEVIAGDTNNCCLASCKQQTVTDNKCEKSGYYCVSSCDPKTQKEQSGLTSYCGSKVCCEDISSGGSSLWIIILIILIILVVLAIIFRDKLKIWWFKMKNVKIGSGPKPTNRPSVPPNYSGMQRPMPPRPGQQLYRPIARRPNQPIQPPPGKSNKDKDFEETMRKLRDMSK